MLKNKQKHRSNRRTIRSIKKRRNNKTDNSRGSRRKCKNSRGKTNKRNGSKRTRIRAPRKKNDIRCNTRRCRFCIKIAQATKEAGEASKKPIELKIEQTNKEIADLEKA